MQGRSPDHDVVREDHGERLVADQLLGHQDGMAQAQLLLLPHVGDLGEVADVADLAQHLDLTALLEQVLELVVEIEVVLDRALLAGGDDDHLLDAGRDGLLDRVLDHGPVDEREHLLRLRLRGGEEAGAPAGGGEDSLANAHRTSDLGIRVDQTAREKCAIKYSGGCRSPLRCQCRGSWTAAAAPGQAAPLAASWGSAFSPPRWRSAAAPSTRAPPATWTGPSASPSMAAASSAPNTGSRRATIEVRVGPMERMPSRKRSAGTPAPAMPAHSSAGRAAGSRNGASRRARPRDEDQEEECSGVDAHDAEGRLFRGDRPEAAAAEQDVDRLHRGGEEGQPEPHGAEGDAARCAAEDDHGHAERGKRQRRRPHAREALLAEEHRGRGHHGRVRVEAKQGQRDARLPERREDREVEHDARAARQQEGRERARRERTPANPGRPRACRYPSSAASATAPIAVRQSENVTGVRPSVVGLPRDGPERAEQAGGDGDGQRAADRAPGRVQGAGVPRPAGTGPVGGPGSSGRRRTRTILVNGIRTSAEDLDGHEEPGEQEDDRPGTCRAGTAR